MQHAVDLAKAKLEGNPLAVVSYFLLVVVLLFVYHLASDGDFSFSLSLSGLMRMFAFCLLAAHVATSKNGAAGISAKSLCLFALAFFSRFWGVKLGVGYLPVDKSGDYLPYIEALCFLLAVGLLVLVLVVKRQTYAKEEDSFGKNVIPQIPHTVGGVLYLFVPCLLLAAIFHPSLNNNVLSDLPWTLALYLESVAIVPQLVMFQKSKKPVEKWTAHYVFALALARFLSLVFWASSYHELNGKDKASVTSGWIGLLVVVFELVGMLILADYSYYWLVSVRAGRDISFAPGAGYDV